MKQCSKCGEQKSLSQFSKNKSAKNGYAFHCKSCAKIQAANWYKANTEKVILRTTQWAKNNVEKKKKIARKNHIKRNYGISLEQETALKLSQNNKCAICEEELSVGYKCHIDHNHTSGKVRGILCHSCNTGLGKFKEDPKIFAAALTYLKKYN